MLQGRIYSMVALNPSLLQILLLLLSFRAHAIPATNSQSFPTPDPVVTVSTLKHGHTIIVISQSFPAPDPVVTGRRHQGNVPVPVVSQSFPAPDPVVTGHHGTRLPGRYPLNPSLLQILLLPDEIAYAGTPEAILSILPYSRSCCYHSLNHVNLTKCTTSQSFPTPDPVVTLPS